MDGFLAGKGPYFQSNKKQSEEVYIPSREEKRSVAGGLLNLSVINFIMHITEACECLPNISLFAGHLRIIRGKI